MYQLKNIAFPFGRPEWMIWFDSLDD
jgi:hypothetical protein